MPISTHFLESFEQFISNYKLAGASSYLSWGKELNHSEICGFLEEILRHITSNKEMMHDASVIEYISIPINLSATTNRYLLDSWNKFLGKYNAVAELYTPISVMRSTSEIHFQVAPEGNASERMMRDLRTALDSTKKAQEFSRKAHLSELELLKQEVAELTRENMRLAHENLRLKEQETKDHQLRSLEPKIITAQQQLASFAELLGTLHELTSYKPTVAEQTPSIMFPPALPLNKSPASSSSGEGTTYSERTGTIVLPAVTPPVPAPVINIDATPKDIPTQPLVQSEEKPITAPTKAPPPPTTKKYETKGTFSGQGFLNELSKELAKRKANKEIPFASTEAASSEQKKNTSPHP